VVEAFSAVAVFVDAVSPGEVGECVAFLFELPGLDGFHGGGFVVAEPVDRVDALGLRLLELPDLVGDAVHESVVLVDVCGGLFPVHADLDGVS
jgi:hypothetical protein